MSELKIKVRKYTLRANGPGYMVAVPPEWVHDLGMKVGDPMDALRTGSNKLYYEPSKQDEKEEE